MRRLYIQIYLAFVAIGFATMLLSGALASLFFDDRPELDPFDASVVMAAASAPDHQLQDRIAAATQGTDAHVTVWNAQGQVLATLGEPLPAGRTGWFRQRHLRGIRIRLSDDRWLGVAHLVAPGSRFTGLALLVLVVGAVGIGCYPLARRITRRLELVEAGMERWGDGDLSARIPVVGRDEVASVAQSFNAAAARVEQLFQAQRRVLASASHELRSPLARLRMALELVSEQQAPEGWIEAAIRDVEELDLTVDDVLSVGRMQALTGPVNPEPINLGTMLQEEAAHVGASVVGSFDEEISGDPRLIRRLIRNLLENAHRHGAPPIEAHLHPDGFSIRDRGPGVPPADKERMFEPFFRPDTHDEGRDGGVGLGLHLVREIALHHGWEVRYEPRPGGGAIFRVISTPTIVHSSITMTSE